MDIGAGERAMIYIMLSVALVVALALAGYYARQAKKYKKNWLDAQISWHQFHVIQKAHIRALSGAVEILKKALIERRKNESNNNG